MAYRYFLRSFFKNFNAIRPALICAANGAVFTTPDPPKTNNDQKLQFETPNAFNLSYDYLIKLSTLNAVNSASEALTLTYSAIETNSKEYRILLTKLIALMNEAIMQDVADSHWDEILEIRLQMQAKKQILIKFIDYMEYVHKMAEAASEISFLVGMDNLSTSLTQRIDDAVGKIQDAKVRNTLLEEEFVKVQEESIKNSKRKMKNSEDIYNEDIQIIDLDNLEENE